MFRTIVVGYDGPERGGEAIALAEVLRDPRKGTLVLTAACPAAPLPVDGFVVPETVDGLREQALRTLGGSRRAAGQDPGAKQGLRTMRRRVPMRSDRDDTGGDLT